VPSKTYEKFHHITASHCSPPSLRLSLSPAILKIERGLSIFQRVPHILLDNLYGISKSLLDFLFHVNLQAELLAVNGLVELFAQVVRETFLEVFDAGGDDVDVVLEAIAFVVEGFFELESGKRVNMTCAHSTTTDGRKWGFEMHSRLPTAERLIESG